MFRKVMSISDALMWRYWELLTDLPLAEVSALKQREPMGVKMELAGRIVADFHSPADAAQALEDFNREVRQGAEPSDMEEVPFPESALGPDGMNVAKFLLATGLAPSRTEAERLVKSHAVEFNSVPVTKLKFTPEPGPLVVHVGKKWKRVIVPE
jgi:tyrosyl-tRNA synthetase